MIINGNKKSQLLGTAQDDIFYPSGNVSQELTLNPGNDTYNLVDPTWYDFSFTPVNYYTSTGATINLGTDTAIVGGVSLKPSTISDGYGGIDTVNFSNNPNNYPLRFFSGPYDDYLNTVGSNFTAEWRISPGAGNDTITTALGCAVYITGAANLNVNLTGLSGRVQLDQTASVAYNYSSSMRWEFVGPSGSNKIINTAPNTDIYFHLYSGTTIGEQTITSSGNDVGIYFANYTNANINITGLSGIIQVDSKTLLNYKVPESVSDNPTRP